MRFQPRQDVKVVFLHLSAIYAFPAWLDTSSPQMKKLMLSEVKQSPPASTSVSSVEQTPLTDLTPIDQTIKGRRIKNIRPSDKNWQMAVDNSIIEGMI